MLLVLWGPRFAGPTREYASIKSTTNREELSIPEREVGARRHERKTHVKHEKFCSFFDVGVVVRTLGVRCQAGRQGESGEPDFKEALHSSLFSVGLEMEYTLAGVNFLLSS